LAKRGPAFWGLPQMTKSFEIKRLKTHRVFNLLAPFAIHWQKYGPGFGGKHLLPLVAKRG